MTDNLKKWLELVSADEALQEEIRAMQKEKPEDRLKMERKLAERHGIMLTEADYRRPETGALDDDELDTVAGGTCACVVVGGGGGTDQEDGDTYGCACVAGGFGGDGGDIMKDEKHANCACPLLGGGTD